MSLIKQLLFRQLVILMISGIMISACASNPALTVNTNLPKSTLTSEPASTPAIITPSQTISPIVASPTLTITTAQSATHELRGCHAPSDRYDRVVIDGHHINARTYEMLEYAQTFYSGPIDLVGDAITQGSYTSAVAESFGTHAGGGAVDLSVMAPGSYTILHDDIEPLIWALRLAGFAAWYRDFDDLYPGSPVHIHAIAIGDRELSNAARAQLTGPHGYFLGFDGLPSDNSIPKRDPHGGPIVCSWMIDMGYPDKTATPSPEEQ